MAMNKFPHASNRENLAIIQQYFYGQIIHSIQDWELMEHQISDAAA